MQKFIAYEKLSKKKQRELDAQKRSTWGCISPITRHPENPKAYNRKRARTWEVDSPNTVPFFMYNSVKI